MAGAPQKKVSDWRSSRPYIEYQVLQGAIQPAGLLWGGVHLRVAAPAGRSGTCMCCCYCIAAMMRAAAG